MKFTERVRAAARAFGGERAFATGPGVVEPFEVAWGHDETTFSPEEYGNYLATSNAVYACASLRADTLSGIPLRCYRVSGNKKIEVNVGPVVQLMNKVNDFWTMNRLLTMTELSLCLWGKNYWAVERGPNGQPMELWWMKPDRVKVYPHPVNYVRGFGYQPTTGGPEIWFDPDEIIWMRFPNPLDEFSGLSPLGAARLAADLASGAAKSNLYLFQQGYQAGGIVMPPKGSTLTPEQAVELEASLDKRFKGVDKAHRWGVMRFETELKSLSVTPKDAEFLGTLTWSLEEVARAYKVPLDMIGGQRTYENVQAAERAFWYRTMEPESRFITSELVEQLLPMFNMGDRRLPLQVDLIEFDLSRVPILQDAESEKWTRAKEQIGVGAITVNEWRKEAGLEPVKWGDVWWAPGTVMPIESDELPEMPMAEVSSEEEDKDLNAKESKESKESKEERSFKRVIELNGEEHQRLWRKFERFSKKWERKVGAETAAMFRRQEESILARLKKEELTTETQRTRSFSDVADDPFNKPEWVKKFRVMMRLLLAELVEEVGTEALEALGLTIGFVVKQPAVQRFIERQAQRFAVEVNETTWDALKESLSAGLEAGEEMPKLVDRVGEVMGDRIQSSEEVIARTEVNRAANGGTLEAWKQSGVVEKKSWLSALLPDRTRDSHVEAHVRYQAYPIPIDEDFEVGSGRGPCPGMMGVAEEDINCLCTMTAEVG
jgi:HK97 family phage portal protein